MTAEGSLKWAELNTESISTLVCVCVNAPLLLSDFCCFLFIDLALFISPSPSLLPLSPLEFAGWVESFFSATLLQQ